jgi:hypothetical protein
LFAARRLEADGVVFLFAIRDGQATLLERAELRELRLAPLDRRAAEALLASRSETSIAPEVAEQLLLAAAGNPRTGASASHLLLSKPPRGGRPLAELAVLRIGRSGVPITKTRRRF